MYVPNSISLIQLLGFFIVDTSTDVPHSPLSLTSTHPSRPSPGPHHSVISVRGLCICVLWMLSSLSFKCCSFIFCDTCGYCVDVLIYFYKPIRTGPFNLRDIIIKDSNTILSYRHRKVIALLLHLQPQVNRKYKIHQPKSQELLSCPVSKHS